VRIDDIGQRVNFSTYCSARINVIDLNDNPAKMRVIKFLNESVQSGFYALNSMSESNSFSATSILDFAMGQNHQPFKNQIEILENNTPYVVLALIRVFDRDSLSNYKFSIQSATNSHEDTTMFEVRFSDRVNREFELIATASFNSELIQNYRLKIILYDLDVDTEIKRSDSLMYTKRPLTSHFDYHRNNFQVIIYLK
jgi:hypothetical protein